MKFQRTLVLLALLLAALLVVMGCGGAAPADSQPAAEEPAPAEAAPVEEEAAEAAAESMAAGTEEGQPYKIGFIASITGPGSGLGVPERNTAEMVAQQLEESGITGPDGVRHPVQVIVLDDESNPDAAASAASRLINEEQVDVLVAGTLSGNSMAIVPLATEAEVPKISMASALSIVKDPETGETRRWIFKTPQENLHSAQWQAEYLQAQGITQVCYLYENSGYGQDTLAQGEAAFGPAGIEVVYSDTFERTDTEFPQMVSMQGANCEAVVIGSIPPGASMAQAAVRESMPDALILQGHGVCNQQFIDLAPGAVEGTPLPCGRLLVADTLPDDDPQKALLQQYIEDYTVYTSGEPVSTFGGHAYDAMLWAVEALGSLDGGMSLPERRAAIRDYIENNIKDWPGTGGIFTLTPDDHLGLEYTGLSFVKIEDGKYVYFPKDQW